MNRMLDTGRRLLLLCAALAGCSSPGTPPKHYALEGEVIAVDVPNKLVTVKHGEIPGLMQAMTMQYMAAEEKEIAALHPGDKISADLVVGEDRHQLEKITVVQKAQAPAMTPSEPGRKPQP